MNIQKSEESGFCNKKERENRLALFLSRFSKIYGMASTAAKEFNNSINRGNISFLKAL
jgi:hypothetical protein